MSVTPSKPQTAEMNPGPGFRFRCDVERVAPEVVAGFRDFDTPAISDLMNRLYTMVPAVSLLTDPGVRLVGPACTVKVFPGDNLMVHKSLDVARPGDVVVVDTSSSMMTAVLGDLVCTKAKYRGIAGFVVDGLVRDLPGILRLGDMPVFARGVTPLGPLHRGPGELNYPISAGGIVVHPGDLVVADLNGVVIVPRENAEDVLKQLRERSAQEADYVAGVARGDFSNDWVDVILTDEGVSSDGREPARR